MSKNQIIEQKLAGMLSVLDAVSAAQLHHPISEQYAENYNLARQAVISENLDLADICPPAVDVPPDGVPSATYLEIKTYCGELHNLI